MASITPWASSSGSIGHKDLIQNITNIKMKGKVVNIFFNDSCKNIDVSYLKAGDNSMVGICFRATAKGDLSHLSYFFCKPEPLRI